MNTEQQIQDLNKKIQDLTNELSQFQSEYYRNNFSGNQTFTKTSNFTTRLKVPNYSSVALAQLACEVGEIVEVGGKLYICTVANTTMTIVGTQT